jgi:hypothetical protein
MTVGALTLLLRPCGLTRSGGSVLMLAYVVYVVLRATQPAL